MAYNKKFFENDAMPPWVFDFPEKQNEKDFSAFKRNWNERHGGSKNKGKFGYIYGGTKIQELGKTPKDA